MGAGARLGLGPLGKRLGCPPGRRYTAPLSPTPRRTQVAAVPQQKCLGDLLRGGPSAPTPHTPSGAQAFVLLNTIFQYILPVYCLKMGKTKLGKYKVERKITPLLEITIENSLVYFLPCFSLHPLLAPYIGILRTAPLHRPGPAQEGPQVPGSPSPHGALGLFTDTDALAAGSRAGGVWAESGAARAKPRGGDTATAAAGPRPGPAHAGVSVPAGR